MLNFLNTHVEEVCAVARKIVIDDFILNNAYSHQHQRNKRVEDRHWDPKTEDRENVYPSFIS